MPTSLKTLLKQVGLSQVESNTYLACLKLGEASVSEIAHEIQMSRTTTASILERLAQKGFLTVHKRRGKKQYWIEDPHVLVEHEKAHVEVIEQLATRLHHQYHQADKKPSAEIFDTRERIVHLITKVIDELGRGDTICTFESPSAHHYHAVVTDELFDALAKQKVKKGIQTKSLIPLGQEGFIRSKSLEFNIEVKTLPKGVLFESSFWMFKNSLVLFSGTHTFAVLIRHKHMKESMKNLFDMTWNLSAPIKL